MELSEIRERREALEAQLALALSTMEKKDDIKHIREELILLQKKCTHPMSNVMEKNGTYYICPYCGKKI